MIPPRKVWIPQTRCLIYGWLGLRGPARGESCLPGRRRGPAAPRDSKVSCLDHKSSRTSATPTNNPGTDLPGSIPPRSVWKSRPHGLIYDWLMLMESARGESCPTEQRRGPSAPGNDIVPSTDQVFSHTSPTPTTRGQKQTSPGSILCRKVWKSQPYRLTFDLAGAHHGASAPREFPLGTTPRCHRTRGR